jgi:aspartate racemase
MYFQLGILGGMGPLATAKILEKIVCLTVANRDSEHIPILISCNPRIPDRTEALCGIGDSPLSTLYDGIDFLNNMGVAAIIIRESSYLGYLSNKKALKQSTIWLMH